MVSLCMKMHNVYYQSLPCVYVRNLSSPYNMYTNHASDNTTNVLWLLAIA